MSRTIDTQTKIPEEYAHYFDFEAYQTEIQNLEVDDLISQIQEKAGRLQMARRLTHINSRTLDQIEQKQMSDDKAKFLRQKTSLLLGGAAVVLHVTSAILGGANTKPGGAISAIGSAFDKTSTHQDSLVNARVSVAEYNNQRLANMISDHSQQIQSAKTESDKAASDTDRVIQNSRRQAELILGSGQ